MPDQYQEELELRIAAAESLIEELAESLQRVERAVLELKSVVNVSTETAAGEARALAEGRSKRREARP